LSRSGLPSVNETPVGQVLKRERSQLLEQHLSDLPSMQADALRLRFFAGLKFHEIADAMGCSLSTAKNRVRCGLTKMGQSLSSYELSTSESEGTPRAPVRLSGD